MRMHWENGVAYRNFDQELSKGACIIASVTVEGVLESWAVTADSVESVDFGLSQLMEMYHARIGTVPALVVSVPNKIVTPQDEMLERIASRMEYDDDEADVLLRVSPTSDKPKPR